MPEPEVIVEPTVEPSVSSGEGGTATTTPGNGAADTSQTDALTAKLNATLDRVKVFEEAEAKRQQDEQEKRGEYDTVIGKKDTKIESLKAELQAQARKHDLQAAIMEHETTYNKGALLKQAGRIDAETDFTQPFDDLVKLAEAEFALIAPQATHTTGFGSTGGGSGGGLPEQEIATLKELYKQAKSDPKKQDAYIRAYVAFREKHGQEEWARVSKTLG